jgi:phospholipid-binding lipoprotein MlaA
VKPVAQGYVAITTQGIRNHVGYFVSNIGEPARLANFMLEGKPCSATIWMRKNGDLDENYLAAM